MSGDHEQPAETGRIASLSPGQIFVFGSNLAGLHEGGAARQAFEDFGAQWGVGEGPSGRTYAFPTLTADFQQVSDLQLQESLACFYRYAIAHPNLEFILTKVGVGIAGFPEEKMRQLFEHAPANVIEPRDWR